MSYLELDVVWVHAAHGVRSEHESAASGLSGCAGGGVGLALVNK